MATLRERLILSHTLPIVILIPLIGIALVYLLETQVILVNLSQQLARQANLLVEVAADNPTIWQDSAAAQRFVQRYGNRLSAQLMALTPEGVLLASSDPLDKAQEGQRLSPSGLPVAQAGQVSILTDYSINAQADVVDVLAPVLDQQQRVIGLVRLTHIYATIYERFWRLRYLTAEILAAGLLVGVGVGLLLAFTLERPLMQLTAAIERFGAGEGNALLTEAGPVEIRTLMRAYNRLVSQIREQEALRRRLIANLIHEIRRPLGALTSALHALRHGAAEDQDLRSDLHAGMDHELHHLQQLTADLLLLYEQNVGQIQLERRPTDLHEWITTTLVYWRVVAAEKGLTWQAQIPDQLPSVTIDSLRMGQVLGNLLSNAIKFTPSGGAVTVAVQHTNMTVTISVIDSGPGIDPAEQDSIFAPFYRGHIPQRSAQGMGLGLTIARDLTSAHGGQLTVTSTRGEGSCFTITLPLVPTSTPIAG